MSATVTDASPAGIVEIYDTFVSTTPITQKTVLAGLDPSLFYLGRPVAAGSYTVTVSIPDVATAVSPLQSVRSAADARLI
ncbi:MAG: hypothetical protein AAB263_09980, partial [Planctomycetota bacterium]